MTTNEFFTAFSDFLSEDEVTKAYKDNFKSTLMDQTSEKYQDKLFTRTGYRVALIFFEEYGKKHKEFEDPVCYKAFVDWKNRDLEKIKRKLIEEYDTVMYIGKENCDEMCNFVIYDPVVVTTIELMGSLDAFLATLEE